MDFKRFVMRVLHKLGRIARLCLVCVWLVRLMLFNKFRRRPITQTDGPVISLTTYSKRIKTVYFAIESIASGKVLPSRIILWLDDKSLFEELPATIRRLQQRGLEVRLSKNYGPHTKYYPYVESQETFAVPLVTADDDALYPRSWLQELVLAYREFPEHVNCHTAKAIALEGGELSKYSEWALCATTRPSLCHVAHGVCGVIYPPLLLDALRTGNTSFEMCCPKADDLWLHVQAVRAGIKTRQIHQRARIPTLIPGTQAVGLYHENQGKGGNDRQIKATYTEADIKILLTCCSGSAVHFGQTISKEGKSINMFLKYVKYLRLRLWVLPQTHRTYSNLSVAETFQRIYQTRAWGDNGAPFTSGGGSRGPVSEQYSAAVVDFIRDHQVQSVVDLGCGDFVVGRQIVEATGVRYTGVDVVPELIEHHKSTVHDPRVSFQCADITSDPLPAADLCLIRQVLQHLSNDEIAKVLANIGTFRWILVSEDVPTNPRSFNRDKPHGPDVHGYYGSGVYLDRPPFSRPALELWSFGLREEAVLRTVLLEQREQSKP